MNKLYNTSMQLENLVLWNFAKKTAARATIPRAARLLSQNDNDKLDQWNTLLEFLDLRLPESCILTRAAEK
jgi:hypothetical protein